MENYLRYEKRLTKLIETGDNEGIIAFSNEVFADCIEYLKSSFELEIPNLYLILMNHKDYTKLCDELDLLLGKRPRTLAILVGDYLGNPPTVYVDFEKQFSFFEETGKPINFLINLTASYLEELVHSADPSKSETEIHATICDALEGFAEVKLTEEIKKNRLEYAEKVDGKKIS
jgi:hypothetical protein